MMNKIGIALSILVLLISMIVQAHAIQIDSTPGEFEYFPTQSGDEPVNWTYAPSIFAGDMFSWEYQLYKRNGTPVTGEQFNEGSIIEIKFLVDGPQLDYAKVFGNFTTVFSGFIEFYVDGVLLDPDTNMGSVLNFAVPYLMTFGNNTSMLTWDYALDQNIGLWGPVPGIIMDDEYVEIDDNPPSYYSEFRYQVDTGILNEYNFNDGFEDILIGLITEPNRANLANLGDNFGSILTEGDSVDYVFNFPAGTEWALSLTADANTDFDLEVYDPNGVLIAWANDVVYPDQVLLGFVSGLHTIRVTSFTGTGNFVLTIGDSSIIDDPVATGERMYSYSPDLKTGNGYNWFVQSYRNSTGPLFNDPFSEGSSIYVNVGFDLANLFIPEIGDEVIVSYFLLLIDDIEVSSADELDLLSLLIIPTRLVITEPSTFGLAQTTEYNTFNYAVETGVGINLKGTGTNNYIENGLYHEIFEDAAGNFIELVYDTSSGILISYRAIVSNLDLDLHLVEEVPSDNPSKTNSSGTETDSNSSSSSETETKATNNTGVESSATPSLPIPISFWIPLLTIVTIPVIRRRIRD